MTMLHFTRWTIASGVAVALCAASLPAQIDTTRRDTTRLQDTTRRDTTRRDTTMLRTDTTRRDLLRIQGDTSARVTGARSTQRIPIRKSAGDVDLAPTGRTGAMTSVDSLNRVNQARNDSIMAAERARVDSIAEAERARADSMAMSTRGDTLANAARIDSIARAEQMRTDSIARVEQARLDSIARAGEVRTDTMTAPTVTVDPGTQMGQVRRLPGSFYWGLAAGAASPMGDVEDLGYDSGLNISIPIGWHNPAAMFGWRLMLAYNQFKGVGFTTGGPNPINLANPDPKVYSAELNLTARFPFNERRTSSVYLNGGGGLYMFRNFGTGSALGAYLGNDVLDPNDEANESTINKWGINGGAGIEFGIGTSSLFLESRIVNVYTGRDDDLSFDNAFGSRGTTVRWVPLILGFTIR